MALLSFADSAPRAYWLKVGNAYLTFSISTGASREAYADGIAIELGMALSRHFGTAEINPDRAGRDMGQIAEEVLQAPDNASSEPR